MVEIVVLAEFGVPDAASCSMLNTHFEGRVRNDNPSRATPLAFSSFNEYEPAFLLKTRPSVGVELDGPVQILSAEACSSTIGVRTS